MALPNLTLSETIFEAVKKAGIRALVSAGWGGLGGTDVPDDVFILEGEDSHMREQNAETNGSTGNIPHDWLFAEERVAAVCHHGGDHQSLSVLAAAHGD